MSHAPPNEAPLHGRRVVVARARPAPSELAARLVALGAEVIEVPTVTLAALDDLAALDRALARLDQFDGLVFGCAPGVDAWLRRLGETGRHPSASAVPLVAVGTAARDRLRAVGLSPALATDGACRDAIGPGRALLSGRLLLITSEDGRPALAAELAALGAQVESVAAYRLVRRYPRSSARRFDLVVAPSSSAAAALLGSEFGGALLSLPVVALGPRAEAAARRHGASRVVVSEEDSLSSAIAKVLELLGEVHP